MLLLLLLFPLALELLLLLLVLAVVVPVAALFDRDRFANRLTGNWGFVERRGRPGAVAPVMTEAEWPFSA